MGSVSPSSTQRESRRYAAHALIIALGKSQRRCFPTGELSPFRPGPSTPDRQAKKRTKDPDVASSSSVQCHPFASQWKLKPMNKKNTLLFLRTFGLGVVAGMRSLSAPALLRNWTSRQRHLAPTPLDHVATPTVLAALAAGEMVADKLPFTPDRTALPSVAFRAISGALVGSSFCAANRRSPIAGALIGATGAVVATYAVFHLRRYLVKERGLPDMVVALAEDAATTALGRSLLPD